MLDYILKLVFITYIYYNEALTILNLKKKTEIVSMLNIYLYLY